MFLYHLLMLLVMPTFCLRALAEGTLAARLGRGLAGPARVWVHGASIGELTSARAVIAGLEGPVLVTCNTTTALAMVRGWGLPGVRAALAPFDLPGLTGRLLRQTGARALVMVENELWPGRMAVCHRAGVPVAIIGARMSERSARRWRWLGAAVAAALGRVALIAPQDGASGGRFLALGAPAGAIGAVVQLKAFVAGAEGADRTAGRARVLLAASTHEGEEALVLDALPGWADLVILAPRHPDRGDEIMALVARRGLTVARRSTGDAPGGARVYLADTLGEMARWYAMAGVTVIGGTFAARGGHTPYEPAAAGSAILHGPDVANFAEAFAALAHAGGAVAVADGAGLAVALAAMTPDRQADLAARAKVALQAGGDLAGLIAALNRLAG